MLKAQIYQYYPELLIVENKNETKEKLISAVQEIQNELNKEVSARLSDTMLNCRDTVLEAKG